jgi:hypothetical protein
MSLRSRIATVLALVAIGLSITVNAENGGVCSNETLHGSYAFHATGELFAAIARFTFDGKAGLTAIFFGRTPGSPFATEFTGTYSVNADCIVADSWGPPLNSTHVSVIYGHGKGYFILNSSPDGDPSTDTVNSGEAIRQ